MRVIVESGLVLFCLFLLPPVAVGISKMPVASVTLRNPVTIDGKWTDAIEWKDGASYAAGPYGMFVIKDDNKFLYVLVDHTTDLSATTGDFAWVVWDQKNDGGSKPKSDDYDLILTYMDETSYESSVAQGTGTGWGSFMPASSLGISSASSSNATMDPYSKKSHRIYEFQVPRSILDNSTVITSVGFFTGALDQSRQYGIFLPRAGDYRVPDTWAELTFSVPVNEATLATTTATTWVASRISATTTVSMSTSALIVTATVTKLESSSTSQVSDYTWIIASSIAATLIVVILAVILLRRRPKPSGAAVGTPKPVLPPQERDARYVEYLAKLEDLRTRGEISEETYLKLKDEYWERFKRES